MAAPALTIVRSWVPDELREKQRLWTPKTPLGRIVKECFAHLPPDLAGELLDRITSCVVMFGELHVKVLRRDGRVEDYGRTSEKVITTAGVGFLVDAWQNLLELETMKYHALGTSSAVEAVGNTAPTTELTTQYNPDNTRATGSLTENAAAIFETVGTNTLDAGATIEEHALMSNASVGSGVCWDRSLTGSQVLSAGDGLQSTYRCTCSSGG